MKFYMTELQVKDEQEFFVVDIVFKYNRNIEDPKMVWEVKRTEKFLVPTSGKKVDMPLGTFRKMYDRESDSVKDYFSFAKSKSALNLPVMVQWINKVHSERNNSIL